MSIEKKQKVKGLTCITQLIDTDMTYTVSTPSPTKKQMGGKSRV